MASNTPTIRAGVLILESPDGGRHREVRPGSDAWFRWLESARAFIYEGSSGRFTARKRRRSGADYWYAFRRGGGHLYETYLGKARDITIGRLHATLRRLDTLTSRASATQSDLPDEDPQPPNASAIVPGSVSTLAARPSVPQARLSQLIHTAAVDLLTQVVEYPLTVVSAPAGYGKTTALAQLISALRLPAAWVMLDRRDNDPARFWGRVADALERLIPGQGEALRLSRDVRDLSSTERVLSVLSAALSEAPMPTLLILDDYHELAADNRAIHDDVALLIERLPPQLRLVVVSRAVPPLPLAAPRARGQLLELGAADLRFTLPETRSLLRTRTGLNLSDEEIAVLHARTEGWVSALQLAAISLRAQPDPRAWIGGFSGENRYIFDYLAQEVIKRVPSRVYDFALHVCVLGRLCGSLCDAVTRSSDSQAMLEEMERENLFLVPLDDRREWYRLHHLFADVLRRHLRQTRPRLAPRLYARASEWFAAHGQALDAIDYAFEAHEAEEEHTAQLVEAYVPSALASGYLVLLRERLERLPDRLVRERPRLAVAHAYTLFMTGERQLWFQRVREASEAFARTKRQYDTREREILRAEIEALEAATRQTLGADSPHESITKLMRARAGMPRGHEFQHIIALFLAISQTLDGDLRSARQTLDDLMRASEAYENSSTDAFTSLVLGTVMLAQGRLDDALALSDSLARRLEGFGKEDLHARIDSVRGSALYARNDLERALEYLQHGGVMRYNRGTYLLEFLPTLAYTRLALGDAAAAHRVIEDGYAEWAESQAANRPLIVWIGPYLRAHRARVWLLEGNIEAAAAWGRELEPSDDAPTGGLAWQAPYIREWEEIVLARLYLAERRASDAITLLDRLSEDAHAAGRVARLLEILILRATACDALGDLSGALQSLQQAVELGEPQRFVRPFVEGGRVIRRLLSLLSSKSTARGRPPRSREASARLRPYIGSLLDALTPVEPGDSGARARRPSEAPGNGEVSRASGPELTPQQRRVLRLIAAGASNKAIAKELVVAPSTAKRHVSNLFRRLDVHSRTQAVARARDLGYLIPDQQVEPPSDAVY